MSLRSIFKIFLPKGHLWSKDSRTRDGRRGYETLNDALDTLARERCCGVDCCEGVLRLTDQVTGEVTVISVSDGSVLIDADGTGDGGAVPVGDSVTGFGEFYALMPDDNASTVAQGAAVEFPEDGPNSADGIVRSSATQFVLPAIGTYQVSYNVPVDEAGQLVIALGGTEIARTVNGRATGTSSISDTRLITTTAINQVLTIQNPAANAAALTITPNAGGAGPASASLIVRRVA